VSKPSKFQSPQNALLEILAAALERKEIKRRDFVVGRELGLRHGPTLSWPRSWTYAQVGAKCGYSVRTVQRAMDRLRELGLIEVERRWRTIDGETRQRAPRFHFPARSAIRAAVRAIRRSKTANVAVRHVIEPESGQRTRRQGRASSRQGDGMGVVWGFNPADYPAPK
jgi:DNA-binding transcriptional ArsR family regulator